MIKTITTAVSLCLTGPAFADKDLCAHTYVLAVSAVANRDKGATEAQLRAPLPPWQAASAGQDSPAGKQVLLMHQIVDEIYQAPNVDGKTYAVYKAEQCYRLSVKKPIQTNFQTVVPMLTICARLENEAKTQCAMEAAGSSENDDSSPPGR